MRRLAFALIAPLAILTIAAVAWLWPKPLPSAAGDRAAPERTGEVTAIQPAPCPPTSVTAAGASVIKGQVCGTASVRLADGLGADSVIRVEMPTGPGAPTVAKGDHVVLVESEGPDGVELHIVDHQRGLGVVVLVAALALSVIAFARWRGVSALVGLVVSFAVLLGFVIPAILGGGPPVAVALAGSSVIILAVLYLTQGFSLTTTVAVLGTLASLTLTGLLSLVAVRALRLSGITDDTSTFLGMLGTGRHAGPAARRHRHRLARGARRRHCHPGGDLGHVALVGHLLPLLRAGAARVVSQSSIAARRASIDWEDLQGERRYDAMRAYRQSKLAIALFGLELDRRSTQAGWGIRSIVAHPGVAATSLVWTYVLMTYLPKTKDPMTAFLLLCAAYVILTGYTSINAIVKAELFPAHIRALGVGLGYGLANSAFGGTAPLIHQALKKNDQVPLFIAYVTICIAISLVVYAFFLKNKARTALDEEQGHAYAVAASPSASARSESS